MRGRASGNSCKIDGYVAPSMVVKERPQEGEIRNELEATPLG
jgi:hypothetical protein